MSDLEQNTTLSLEPGQYSLIQRGPGGLVHLTLELGAKIPVTTRYPMGSEKQKWVMVQHPDNKYVIKSAAFKGTMFLAPTEVKENAFLTVSSDPFEWRLEKNYGPPNEYHIVAPGVAREELCAEMSHDENYTVILRPLQASNDIRAWIFVRDSEGN